MRVAYASSSCSTSCGHNCLEDYTTLTGVRGGVNAASVRTAKASSAYRRKPGAIAAAAPAEFYW